MREYALLFTPRRRVCIISFIIQLVLNSTLFRSHDRSLRPSSSFFPRIHSTRGKAPCSTSRARGGCSRDHLCYSFSPYPSSCQRFPFSFTRKPNAIYSIYFLFLQQLINSWMLELRSLMTRIIVSSAFFIASVKGYVQRFIVRIFFRIFFIFCRKKKNHLFELELVRWPFPLPYFHLR